MICDEGKRIWYNRSHIGFLSLIRCFIWVYKLIEESQQTEILTVRGVARRYFFPPGLHSRKCWVLPRMSPQWLTDSVKHQSQSWCLWKWVFALCSYIFISLRIPLVDGREHPQWSKKPGSSVDLLVGEKCVPTDMQHLMLRGSSPPALKPWTSWEGAVIRLWQFLSMKSCTFQDQISWILLLFSRGGCNAVDYMR